MASLDTELRAGLFAFYTVSLLALTLALPNQRVLAVRMLRQPAHPTPLKPMVCCSDTVSLQTYWLTTDYRKT
jgi:hypothetical protein